jgi:hypothetical protein
VEMIAPPRHHECSTPGNLKPQSDWPMGMAFGQQIRIPVLHEIGTLWQCTECKRWWHCADTPPNPPGGGYTGGGRDWLQVRWWNVSMRRRIEAESWK